MTEEIKVASWNSLTKSFEFLTTSPDGYSVKKQLKIMTQILCFSSLFIMGTQATAGIQMAVSLTWNGKELKKTNLETLEKVRQQFPKVPFIHFISPDYYSADYDDSTNNVTESIKNLIHPIDSVGLKMHGSQHITELANVRPLMSPTFWGEKNCKAECMRSVPLDAWSEKEIQKMIAASSNQLEQEGYNIGPWFISSGWLATPKVLSAARAEGFRYDFSAVPPSLLQEQLAHYPLLGWLQQLWASKTVFSQPQRLPTSNGWVQEMGQNMASMDYLSMTKILKTFQSYTNLQKMTPEKDYFLHLGMNVETALHTAPKFSATLKRMIKIAQSEKVGFKFYQPPGSRSKKVQKASSNHISRQHDFDRHPPHSRY